MGHLLNKILLLILFILVFQGSTSFAKIASPSINPVSKLEYININWWENFSDPYLKKYIIQAVEKNHEAKSASWVVEQYRQSVKMQFSQQLPSLSVGGTYILNHLPDNIKNTKNNIFAVPFLASYEADIFLKNRDKTRASKKAYDASKYEEQGVYISLASDVATNYINILKYDKQIELQQKINYTKSELLNREQKRYIRGVVDVKSVNKYKNDYEQAKSSLEELLKSRDKALNQFSVLIGESSQNSLNISRGKFDDFIYNSIIPAFVSSDLVFSRPDLKATEAQLEEAKINVCVARKEFLPRFNINGIYSLSNIGPDGFGTWGSTVAAMLAGATLDLFKGGYKVANLKYNKAKYEQLFESYRQIDLNAIKEVDNSYVLINNDKLINQNTIKGFITVEDDYKRSIKSYKLGTIAYTDLLLNEERFLTSMQSCVNSKEALLIDYITLYKAVGGKL